MVTPRLFILTSPVLPRSEASILSFLDHSHSLFVFNFFYV